MIQVLFSIDNECLTQYVIYNTKFVQKLAFTYRDNILSVQFGDN